MRPSPLLLVAIASLVAGAASCGGAPVPPPPPADTMSLDKAGVITSIMDPRADACSDLYQLACGTLIQKVQIPADQPAWGPTYELQQKTETYLRTTLEKAAKDPGNDPIQKKLGAWYGACMDEAGIEKAGTATLAPLLAIVAKVKDPKSLHAAIAELHKRQIFPVFDVSSMQDFKDATQMIAGIDQDGLGLPNRDYYLDGDASMKDMRAFYQGHVERMLGLLGDKSADAKKEAEEILRIETAIAKLHQDKVVRRDPYKVYNRVDREGLKKAAPGFPWDAYFATLGFSDIKDVSVNSVEMIKGLDALMQSEKPEAWQTYLRWHVVRSQAGRLPAAFVSERFALRKKLTGQEEDDPRWRKCVRSTDGALGELLAQQYVKDNFDAESKKDAEDLVRAVRAAMKTELEGLPWMDAPTRAAAQEKLAKMGDKIGYPARWRTYDFEVSPTAYASNAIASDVFELARLLRKVGKPVDRTEWDMTPPTVNAYYNPSLNEMVFPAGILQPPFFDKKFIPAVNYGATGGVMGHELTHGFDDEGSQFDGSGNLRNWWSDSTNKLFKEQTKCVVDQYSGYEAVPGVKLNGELTAGENIADIGGLKLAYKAFREARKGSKEPVRAGGYTEDQIFFLAYAQSWCEKARPEVEVLRAKTNPHSPPRYRVNGVVSDVPEFGEAFSCKQGAPMRPAKVCSVW